MYISEKREQLLLLQNPGKGSLWLFTFMHWRRKWQPTPVFLPGESHGQRSLVDYSPWDGKELDMTERLSIASLDSNTLSSMDQGPSMGP